MEAKLFDPGKYVLLVTLVLLCVLPTDAEYECNYLELIPSRPGWFSIEEMTCEYGCCGDLWDQRCCAKQEVDNKHWVVAVSVIGGLLGVAVIVIVLLCILKKKNLERAKIYTGNPPPRHRNKGTTSYCDIAQEGETPPPPYSPRNYAVFITDSSARTTHVPPGRSEAEQLGAHGQQTTQNRPTMHGQPNISGRHNVVGQPNIHGRPSEQSMPPAYSFLEAGHNT